MVLVKSFLDTIMNKLSLFSFFIGLIILGLSLPLFSCAQLASQALYRQQAVVKKSTVERVIETDFEIKLYFEDGLLVKRPKQLVANARNGSWIQLYKADINNNGRNVFTLVTDFQWTGRTLNEVKLGAPANYIDLNSLKHDRLILDTGTGNGKFVKDLHSNEVNAIGLDLIVTKKDLDSGLILEASSTNIPIRDHSVDTIYNNYSTFHFQRDPKLWTKTINEYQRVLSSVGKIRIAGVYLEDVSYLKNLMNKVLGKNYTITDVPNTVNPKVYFIYADHI